LRIHAIQKQETNKILERKKGSEKIINKNSVHAVIAVGLRRHCGRKGGWPGWHAQRAPQSESAGGGSTSVEVTFKPSALDGVTRCWTGLHGSYSHQN
jgi:hypothetical protein